jgi:hypothetical protein
MIRKTSRPQCDLNCLVCLLCCSSKLLMITTIASHIRPLHCILQVLTTKLGNSHSLPAGSSAQFPVCFCLCFSLHCRSTVVLSVVFIALQKYRIKPLSSQEHCYILGAANFKITNRSPHFSPFTD